VWVWLVVVVVVVVVCNFTTPIPKKSVLNKMSAGDVEELMNQLGFPQQGSKNKNKEYMNARR